MLGEAIFTASWSGVTISRAVDSQRICTGFVKFGGFHHVRQSELHYLAVKWSSGALVKAIRRPGYVLILLLFPYTPTTHRYN